MKELTRTYGDLLQDKRVRSEQNKYEAFSRQRNTVLGRYRKVYQAYTDLQAGLSRAQQFYDEMKDTVDSLKKNVDSFVENRRSEGGQLLGAIEAAKGSGADREQARLKELMERMSVNPATQASASPVHSDLRSNAHRPPSLPQHPSFGGHQAYNPAVSPPVTPRYPSNGIQSPAYQNFSPQPQPPTNGTSYNPSSYGPVSPPAHQQYFSPPPHQQQPYNALGHQQQTHSLSSPPQYGAQSVPPGWHPPPPPPGPPPSTDYSAVHTSQYPSGPGGYASDPRRAMSQGQGQGQGQGDPWAGLNAWK